MFTIISSHVTGIRIAKNNEELYNRLDRNNTGLTDTRDAINNNSGVISNRIREVNDNLTALEEHKLRAAEATRNSQIDQLTRTLETYDRKISEAKNAANGAKDLNMLDEEKRYREEEKLLQTLRLNKLIELQKLKGEDTADLELELRKREDSKARAIIKAEQEQQLKLMQREFGRETASTPGSLSSPRPESYVPIASATFAQSPVQEATPIELTPEAKASLRTYRKNMEKMLKSLHRKGGFGVTDGTNYVISNYINDIMKILGNKSSELTTDYCNISFVSIVQGIEITTQYKKFDPTNLYSQLLNLGRTLEKEADTKKSSEGLKLTRSLLDQNSKIYKDYTSEMERLYPQQQRQQLKPQPISIAPFSTPETKPRSRREFRQIEGTSQGASQGQGIASFRHIQGGSISSFIDKMHEIIEIRNITKFNNTDSL